MLEELDERDDTVDFICLDGALIARFIVVVPEVISQAKGVSGFIASCFVLRHDASGRADPNLPEI